MGRRAKRVGVWEVSEGLAWGKQLCASIFCLMGKEHNMAICISRGWKTVGRGKGDGVSGSGIWFVVLECIACLGVLRPGIYG